MVPLENNISHLAIPNITDIEPNKLGTTSYAKSSKQRTRKFSKYLQLYMFFRWDNAYGWFAYSTQQDLLLCRAHYHQFPIPNENRTWHLSTFVGLAYQGKDIVFRLIIEYSSLMDFGPIGNNRPFFIWRFLKHDNFCLCWNLRLVIELSYLEPFWFLLENFSNIIFLHCEIFEFP
jgi:hypothetical protein